MGAKIVKEIKAQPILLSQTQAQRTGLLRYFLHFTNCWKKFRTLDEIHLNTYHILLPGQPKVIHYYEKKLTAATQKMATMTMVEGVEIGLKEITAVANNKHEKINESKR